MPVRGLHHGRNREIFWGALYDREPGCAKIRGEARENVGMLELTPEILRTIISTSLMVFLDLLPDRLAIVFDENN